MQKIVLATIEFSLDNTEKHFANLSGNQFRIYFKGLIDLKIVLVKLTYPEG